MLTFEFIQGCEFSRPLYDVFDGGEFIGDIFFNDGWHFMSSNEYGVDADCLRQIADKIDQLNKSIKQQSFFWGL